MCVGLRSVSLGCIFWEWEGVGIRFRECWVLGEGLGSGRVLGKGLGSVGLGRRFREWEVIGEG